MGPTKSQKIISFNEKHHQKIVRENRDLKAWLYEILEVAHLNKQIQDHFEAMERKILKSRSLREMARILVGEIKSRFQVDHVTLCLALDPEDSLQKGHTGHGRRRASSCLRIVAPEVLQECLPKRIRAPILKGQTAGSSHPFFSEEEMSEIHSTALVPLFASNRLIGTLNLGSRDPDRYTANKATDFLKNLGCKISLVMDSILTRQRLLELSGTDQLTGIFNRRCFDETLSLEVERARRYGIPLACIALGLDNFKEISERYGRRTSSQALRHVAQILKRTSRRHDIVARYGGEHFSILLPHTTLKGAARAARKHKARLSASPLVLDGGEPIQLGVSIGVAAMPETSIEKPSDLMREADRRLDLAKGKGGGCAVSAPMA